jgi:GT2 family glycosyltransferase
MRVLVGCPTSDHKKYCLKEYLDGINNLTYKYFDLILVDNSKKSDYYNKLKECGIKVIKDKYEESAKERVINSRNKLREYFLKNDYDYLLSLEQDVVPPKNVIERLMKHKKEICSGLYFKEKGGELIPIMYVHHKDDFAKLLRFEEIPENKLVEVITSGLGCVLISRKVMEKVKFRYEKDSKPWDDVWFCEDAREKDFKVYVDTSVRCKHFIKGMNWDEIKK